MQGGVCKCPHHKVVPTLVVLFGLMFLLEALGFISTSTVDVVWPLFVIAGGLMKLTGGMCKCCGGGAMR